MKQKENGVMLLFVTVLTILIWLWAAGQTKHETSLTTTIRFRPPEGSMSTVSPEFASITLTLAGPRSAVETAKAECANGLDLTIAETDGSIVLSNMADHINAIEEIKLTGAEAIVAEPTSFKLEIQTMVTLEAAVEPVLQNMIVSGDVTVDPATVIIQVPKSVRDELPDAITVQAVVSDSALEQLLPGVVHTRDAVIRLPHSLDVPDVTVTPSRVTLTFKIQTKTQLAVLPQVRVILAGPPEDYAAFTIALPRKSIADVTVEADNEIIEAIKSGDYTVFAVVRLSSRDMEQGITSKHITTFLAIDQDGVGHPLSATVEDPAMLNIELQITPAQTAPTQ